MSSDKASSMVSRRTWSGGGDQDIFILGITDLSIIELSINIIS
jgi:hypothetical protein